MKIIWSGRSHNFTSQDLNYFLNVIKNADPLTQGTYLKKFEKNFGKFIKNDNVLAVSSAASGSRNDCSSIKIKKK